MAQEEHSAKSNFMRAMKAIELQVPEEVLIGFASTVFLYTSELERENERLRHRNDYLEAEVRQLRYSRHKK